MLYLTTRDAGYPTVYYALISTGGQIFCAAKDSGLIWCTDRCVFRIIDIDELDVCAAKLRGTTLFSVVMFENPDRQLFQMLATVDDVNSLLEWKSRVIFS